MPDEPLKPMGFHKMEQDGRVYVWECHAPDHLGQCTPTAALHAAPCGWKDDGVQGRHSVSQAVPVPWTTGYEEPRSGQYRDQPIPPVAPVPVAAKQGAEEVVLFTVSVSTNDEQRTRQYIERLLRAGLHDPRVGVDVDHSVLGGS
jgi:hypothetical protein